MWISQYWAPPKHYAAVNDIHGKLSGNGDGYVLVTYSIGILYLWLFMYISIVVQTWTDSKLASIWFIWFESELNLDWFHSKWLTFLKIGVQIKWELALSSKHFDLKLRWNLYKPV